MTIERAFGLNPKSFDIEHMAFKVKVDSQCGICPYLKWKWPKLEGHLPKLLIFEGFFQAEGIRSRLCSFRNPF